MRRGKKKKIQKARREKNVEMRRGRRTIKGRKRGKKRTEMWTEMTTKLMKRTGMGEECCSRFHVIRAVQIQDV